MKVSRLLCLLLPIYTRWPATASNVFELKQYFEMVFLEISPSAWKLDFLRYWSHICPVIKQGFRAYFCLHITHSFLNDILSSTYRIVGNFRKVKFSKNLRESDFEKIFSKILLLSQLRSCVAIEIRKDIFENDWLFSKFLKITSNFSRYTVSCK